MNDVMRYGKAQGMALVSKYLPKLNPFRHIDVIESLEDWECVYHKYGDMMVCRIDYPIGCAKVKRNAVAGTNGFSESVPDLTKAVREQGDDGVVLVAQTFVPSPPRYSYLGGFNILFDAGLHVVIELVGKGFDGHELTQGLACHERYIVDWHSAKFVESRAKMRRYGRLETVSAKEYQKQRSERVKFLIEDCCYEAEQVEENVPKDLTLLDDESVRLILESIVLELLEQRRIYIDERLLVFGVQGNVIAHSGQRIVQPWEFFCPKRWT